MKLDQECIVEGEMRKEEMAGDKKKEQTPGTMALPAVVAPFTCLLSTVFGPNPVPVCTLRLSVGQITSEVGQDQ